MAARSAAEVPVGSWRRTSDGPGSSGWVTCSSVQPRGWTDEQVENPDEPGLLGAIDLAAGVGLPAGMALADLVGLAPLGMAEVTQGMLARSGGTLRGLQEEVGLARARPALPDGISEDDVAAAVAAVARTIAGEDADA